MMEWVWIAAVSLAAGISASMGLGGGFVLLVYLTATAGVPQLEAQWMNLIFFLPIGGLALWMHLKNRLVEKRVLLPAILCGLLGAALGCWLAGFLEGALLSKIFAGFLAAVGVKEVLQLGGKKENSGAKPPNGNEEPKP